MPAPRSEAIGSPADRSFHRLGAGSSTLLDERRNPAKALADLYRRRWEEEFCGGGKDPAGEFRWRTVRGTEQDFYAGSAPIAVSRLFANRCEAGINRGGGDLPDMRANFRNGMRLLDREIKAMFLAHGAIVAGSVARITAGRFCCLQRERPRRSYPTVSMKPGSEWMKRKAA
ncbi:MAG: hypothetical protein OXI87_00220 [Albidovulum sp.]|nr:hypothetical protein [Albidovulum sp.]MDE0303299.1 hypothetical protein [Albidovulum sp.]